MYLRCDLINLFWSKDDRYRNYALTAGIKIFQILYITYPAIKM